MLIVIGILIFLRVFSHKPLTDYNQNIVLNNLEAEVQVFRDENGIPHIIAENEKDLYRVAGYITAEDRLWQMDLLRRATQGTLSEIFGDDFIKTDLLLRALQISQKSEMIYEHLSEKEKIAIDAYADGVNQFITENINKLPIEFKILGYKPAEWLPQNSLNAVGYMAWDLVTAWSNEITLYKIQQKVDSVLFTDFIPNFDGDSVIYHLAENMPNEIESPLNTLGSKIENLGIIPFMASNNWVVDSEKSANGTPILCNDMHLGYGIPGIWYQMHLVIKDKINVTGVSIPGTPGIVAGHNENIAWGMTNVMLDGTDFYIETLNSDSTQYLLNGEWKDLRIDKEKIITKDGDTVVLQIRYTHRGPIISEFKGITDKAISMRWIGYEYSNEYIGIYKINHASNWDEFREGAKGFGAASQNIIYADKDGNIGIQLTGLVPIRKIPGYHILPGDTTLYDWQGFVDFDSLPVEFNPKKHFLASANNKSTHDVDYYITQYSVQDFRYRRIAQTLSAKDKISVDDMKKLLANQKSIMAEDILPKMLPEFEKLNLKTDEYSKIMEYMKKWDGEMSAESVAAMFFEQFHILFIENATSDELGYNIFEEVLKIKTLSNNVIVNLWNNKNSKLYDNINTKNKVETIDDIILLTFEETIDSLKSKIGLNVDSWNYGELHTITLEHPLAKVKILDIIFKLNKGPYSVGGSNHTVSPYSYKYTKAFSVTHGASERHIFTLENWSNSLTIIPTGISGIPASKFYCDQTERFINDEYHKDYFTIDDVMENQKFKMTFLVK